MRFTKRLNITGKMYEGISDNLERKGFTMVDRKKCTVVAARRESGTDFVYLTFEEIL